MQLVRLGGLYSYDTPYIGQAKEVEMMDSLQEHGKLLNSLHVLFYQCARGLLCFDFLHYIGWKNESKYRAGFATLGP